MFLYCPTEIRKMPMKNLGLLCVLVGMLVQGSNAGAQGAVVTVYSSTDGHIRESGSSFSTTTVLVGRTATAGDFLNGLFSFDLSAIPEGMLIDSISLTLYSAAADAGSVNTAVTFYLYDLQRDFTSAATWTQYSSGNVWEVAGAYGTQDRGSAAISSLAWNPSNPSPARGTAYSFDSTVAFVNAANSALTTDGILNLWLGLDTSVTGRHITSLVSSEDTGSLDPRLTISYAPIPEPTTVWLLMAGLGVAAVHIWKRRRV